MSFGYNHFILESSKLSIPEKEKLALYLLHSVKENNMSPGQWQDEIKRRDEEYNGSENFGVAWEDIKSRYTKN